MDLRFLLFILSIGAVCAQSTLSIHLLENKGSNKSPVQLAPQIQRSYRDGSLSQALKLSIESITIVASVSSFRGYQNTHHTYSVSTNPNMTTLTLDEEQSNLVNLLRTYLSVTGDKDAFFEQIEIQMTLSDDHSSVQSQMDVIKFKLNRLLKTSSSSLELSLSEPEMRYTRDTCVPDVTTQAVTTQAVTSQALTTQALTTGQAPPSTTGKVQINWPGVASISVDQSENTFCCTLNITNNGTIDANYWTVGFTVTNGTLASPPWSCQSTSYANRWTLTPYSSGIVVPGGSYTDVGWCGNGVFQYRSPTVTFTSK